ncbi:outer membrane protein with beta-barrel domain [Rivibacter subsaxonicus]|uniref:Outer membrane protein with beta-barrel domain n=2 Tax=Rivibacter subsaxonicus TaxID=457575 RepID=A0A4Q7W1U0_9BURK|nr:outer membrane protein with beta-barrel domain [Rivibacter subsaxonicus]
MRHSLFKVHAVAAALLLSGTCAWAERPTDRYWAQLQGYWPSIESTARADVLATGQPGTEFSFESDLGLSDRKALPAVLLGMRFFDNWRLEFEYYSLERSATKTLGRQIVWDDTVFDIAAQLHSEFDSSIYRLTAGYSFLKSQDAELGVSLGLHITDFMVSLEGTSNVGIAFDREAKDALAPLPTLGLYGSYAFSPAFGVRARADYLSLKYQDYDGKLLNFEATLDWRFSQHFGAGLGYRYVDYRLDVTKSDWNGQLKYKFNGPFVFLEAAF